MWKKVILALNKISDIGTQLIFPFYRVTRNLHAEDGEDGLQARNATVSVLNRHSRSSRQEAVLQAETWAWEIRKTRKKNVACYEMPWKWRISYHDLTNEQKRQYKQKKQGENKVMKNTLFKMFSTVVRIREYKLVTCTNLIQKSWRRNNTVIWNVFPCSVAKLCRLARTRRLRLQGSYH